MRPSDCQIVKCDSSLQRTHFYCSRVQWRQALHHSSQCLALRMVILGLCAAARRWKPILWSSWLTVLVLTLFPEAVWNSVVSFATEDRWFLRATCFSTRGSRSVILCGLPLHGWAVFAPRRFHFTINSSSWTEICQTDLLERWHPMTVSRWKSMSSSESPFYCQCLSVEIAWLCARFLYNCQQWVWLK